VENDGMEDEGMDEGQERVRIADKPELAPVLGELGERESGIVEQLEAADGRLAALRDELAQRSGRDAWTTTGVVVETLESGQVRILGEVEDPEEGLTFTVELRPRNYFNEENPWRPGQPPRPMSTDAWDFEGAVQAMHQTRISGRKYTVQETVAELEETRYESADEAVAAFVAGVAELEELARSRDPVTSAWVEDDTGTAGGDEGEAEGDGEAEEDEASAL
jgi:hypothetical protein